jgi:uroporphyrinogen decarboxylase
VTKRDRINGVIDGRPADRTPVALWRHFPEQDQRAEGLAEAHVAFQKKYDWDFLKVTPTSGYYGDDWGLRSSFKPNREGVRTYIDRPVKREIDWTKLKRLDITTGGHGREVKAIRLIRKALPDDVILQTIFSPLGIARTLSGETALLRYMRDSAEELHQGLDIIAEATTQFASECLAAGADGLFFATQCATTAYMTIEDYEEFARPYDLRVIDAARSGEITLLHIHGERIMFDELTDYPVQIINWHDRRTPPTIAEARKQFSGTLAAGVEAETLVKESPEAAAAQVKDAIAQAGGTKFIVTAGCVITVDAPEANVMAVRRAVEP